MIIGIDLGTTNSLVAVWQDGKAQLIPNALGEFLTPSVVGFDENDQIIVGQIAKERLQTHPQSTVSLFKRSMGTDKSFLLNNKKFRSEELSAMVLQSLKADAEAYLNETVTQAVISVPAYFSDAQRKATRIAGELAGLTVDTLINEPTAAALAYGLHIKDEHTFMVFDLGGGTFDVSILELFEGVMEVKASTGDNHLGGEDFDTLLVNDFAQTHKDSPNFPDSRNAQIQQRLRKEAQRVRHQLDEEETATFCLETEKGQWSSVYDEQKMMTLFRPLIQKLRQPIETALRDTQLMPHDLNEILMVGGASRMPIVRNLITGLFERFPSIHINPDEAIALGAATQAALKNKEEALQDVVLTDVSPYTLGTEVATEVAAGQYEAGHYLPIIERNTVVPISREQTVTTVSNKQKMLEVNVFQGESRLTKDNIKIGTLNIKVPPKPAGEVSANIRFTYDKNGLLEVDVTIEPTKEKYHLVIENNPGVLSKEEIKASLERLKKLKIHPRDLQENKALMTKLDRMYQLYKGDMRVYIDSLAQQFHRALETQDEKTIKITYREVMQELNEIDNRSLW